MSTKGKYHYTFWVCFAIGLMIGGFIFGNHAHGAPRLKAPVIAESRIVNFRHEIVMYNPNYVKLSVMMNCGKDVELPVIEIFPRVKQTFQFSNAPCKIVKWRKVR